MFIQPHRDSAGNGSPIFCRRPRPQFAPSRRLSPSRRDRRGEPVSRPDRRAPLDRCRAARKGRRLCRSPGRGSDYRAGDRRRAGSPMPISPRRLARRPLPSPRRTSLPSGRSAGSGHRRPQSASDQSRTWRETPAASTGRRSSGRPSGLWDGGVFRPRTGALDACARAMRPIPHGGPGATNDLTPEIAGLAGFWRPKRLQGPRHSERALLRAAEGLGLTETAAEDWRFTGS